MAEAADIVVETGTQSQDDPIAGLEEIRKQLADEQAARQADIAARKEAETRADRERVAREEAERRAQRAGTDAHQFRSDAEKAQYDAVSNAIQHKEQTASALKAQLSALYKEGDFDNVADVQYKMNEVAAELVQLRQGKAFLENSRAAEPQGRQPQSQQDPKEAYIASKSAKTAAWLRQNDRFFSDQSFQQMVVGADGMARGKGIPLDSDAYFKFIEEAVGLRQAEQPHTVVETAPKAAPATQRRERSPEAAPPSRTSGDGRQTSPTSVSLTAEEVAIAPQLFPKKTKDDPDPLVAYARYKQQILDDGSMDRLLRHGGSRTG